MEESIKLIAQLQEENKILKEKLEKQSSIDSSESFNQLFLKAQHISKNGFWSYSFPDRQLLCSEEVYNIFEIEKGTDLSDPDFLSKFILKEDFEKIAAKSITSETAGNDLDFDFHIKVKDGNSKFVSVKSTIERDKNGKRVKIFGSISDITESHFKLEQLQENEQLFRSLFNNLTDIFFIVELVKDKDGNVIDYIYKDVNPIFEMKFDLPKKDIINKRLSNQVQLFQQINPIFKIAAITREPYQDRIFVQSLDSFLDVLIYTPSENLIATIWRDVSLMVEANRTLQESEEKYRQIFAIGNDGLFLVDFFTGNILDVNPAGCFMFGYSKEELLNLNFKELFDLSSNIEQQIFEKKLTNISETNIKNDGTKFPTEASLSYFNWSGGKVVVASVRDISERISAQEDIIKSQKKFKQLFDYSNDAILILKNYKIIDFNQKTQQIFNIPFEVIKNKTLWNLSPNRQINGEDSRMKMVEYIQNALIGNQLQLDWNFQRSDKSVFNADIKLSPIIFDNEKMVQVIVRDVSPQRKLEQERKTKEDRWKFAIEISNSGVWDWNLITNEVYFSTSWKKMIGYEKDEIENKFEEIEKRIHPDDVALMYQHIDSYFSGKQFSFSIDYRFRCKNGSYKWINSKGKIFSYTIEGKPEHFIGLHTDITKQKLQEFDQHAKIANYATTCNSAKIGYWDIDLRTMIFTGSEQTFAIFGLTESNQTSLKHIEDLVHPEDQRDFMAQFISSKSANNNRHNFRIIINNVSKYIDSYSEPIYKGNTLVGYHGVFQDITDFKKQEIQLKDEQNLIKTVADHSEQTIVIQQGNEIIYINKRFYELLGYPSTEVITNSQLIINSIVLEDRIKVITAIEQTLQTNTKSEKLEVRIETKFHKIKWIELVLTTIEYKGVKSVLYLINNISEQKKLELKLSESESIHKSITSKSPLGIAIVDREGVVTFTNTGFEQNTGVSILKKPSFTLADIFLESDFKTILAGIISLQNNEIPYYIEEFKLQNNSWANIIVVPLSTKQAATDKFIIYFENIDVVKKQIDLLSEENQQIKSMLEKSETGVGVFNEDQMLCYGNQSLLRHFEFENSMRNISFNDFRFNATSLQISFNKFINEKSAVQFINKTTNNQLIKVVIVASENGPNKLLSIFTSNETEAISLNESLALKLDKFKTIFEMAPIGIALIDKNRNIILSNKAYFSIFGEIPTTPESIKFDQLIPTEYLDETISKFSALFTGIIPSFNQILQLSSNNESRWISTISSEYKDHFDDISYCIQIIEDITQKKKSEDHLLNDEKLKTLNHLGNSFAHEFNNLLMTMYGNSYLLKSNLSGNNQLSTSANNLFNAISNASELSHKLLSFSKKERTIQVVINIPALIDATIDQMAISHKILVRTNYEQKNEKILGDPSQLQRAIQNVITNAIEAMPNGGELTIETRSVYFHETSPVISELEKGKYLRISIKDTGIGINTKEVSKIFQPFYTTKAQHLSSGLGLTIALKVVTNHNGTIKVDSERNKGTEFKIYLSQPNDDIIETIVHPDEQMIVKGSANIMTVDDEDVVRIVTSELLKKLGYNVFSFANPKKAIQFYKDNKENIDLVILDKQMPVMDGIETYRELKKINNSAKVILLTGYNPDSELEEIFSTENNGLIQKPVSIEKLSKTISSLLYNYDINSKTNLF